MRARRIKGSMKLWLVGLLAGSAVAVLGCGPEEPTSEDVTRVSSALSASNASDRATLALRWAPVHRQDTDQTGSQGLGGAADYITNVDYDGDWIGNNNWDNAGRFAMSAHVYASVVETSTHWFIVYMFFHARDWTDTTFDTAHENDSEGVLMAITRDGTATGALRAAVTVAHTDFFSFVPAGSTFTAGAESIDGTLSLQSWNGANHPVTAQQAKGHGCKAAPYYDIVGDGVIYFPTASTSEVPSSPTDSSVSYNLIDIFASGGLWSRRNDSGLFSSFGTFSGNTSGGCGSFPFICSSNAANAPWGWDDHDDGPARGTLATDPAALIHNYFTTPGAFSLTYTFNPYLGIGG